MSRAETTWYLEARRPRGARRPRRRWWGRLLLVLLALLVLVALWFLRSRLPESFGGIGRAGGAARMAPLGAFEFYFGDAAGRGLQREIRYLKRADSADRQARDVLDALLAGSLTGGLSPWPEDTVVRDLFLTQAGIAYVEFDESLRDDAPAGDYSEWLMVATLTRTLCANFPAVRGVRILVSGRSSGPLVRTMPLEWTFVPAMFDDAG